MKKIVVLFFAFVFCFTAVQADENYYTLSIDTPKETDKLMYTLFRENDGKVYASTPYEIYEVFSSSEGVEVYACFVENQDNPLEDCEMLAIYLASCDYFSGFIYQDVQYSEGLICALYQDFYGYLDVKGNIVIPFQWAAATPFQDGIAKVAYRTSLGYADVWIDREGKIISLDPEYGYTNE